MLRFSSHAGVVRHFFLLPRVVGKRLSIICPLYSQEFTTRDHLRDLENDRDSPSPPACIEDPGETKAPYDHSRKCTIGRILPQQPAQTIQFFGLRIVIMHIVRFRRELSKGIVWSCRQTLRLTPVGH